MISSFEPCFQMLLKHEGGYSNDPRDPGGMTNLGVTARAWSDFIHADTTEEEMRALTPNQVRPLYRIKYWNAVRANDLPGGIDYCVFDFAVNSGTPRAARTLQKAVCVMADGVVGPETIAACGALDVATVIADYTTERLKFLDSLAGWATFGKGGLKRVNEVEAAALAMIGGYVA